MEQADQPDRSQLKPQSRFRPWGFELRTLGLDPSARLIAKTS